MERDKCLKNPFEWLSDSDKAYKGLPIVFSVFRLKSWE